MIQIIIKLIEFFQNLGLIPSQRDQMPQKSSLLEEVIERRDKTVKPFSRATLNEESLL